MIGPEAYRRSVAAARLAARSTSSTSRSACTTSPGIKSRSRTGSTPPRSIEPLLAGTSLDTDTDATFDNDLQYVRDLDTPFHDRTRPFSDKSNDAVKHRAINKEVLAEFMAAG